MMNKLSSWFNQSIEVPAVDDAPDELELATAALMMEVARADFEQSEEERSLMLQKLGARLKLTEGDNLRHAVLAIALTHISDHLVAAVLAEVDVKVRHGHAFGIQETFEQKSKTNWIEIGDGEHIGHQRTGAGTTAWADGYALLFGPLDEVGNDQKIALVVHAGDDIELEREAFRV